jgi:hypothetical protein
MNIPEGWPTEEMIDAGEGVDPNEHASKGSWVQSVLEAALAAAPTPPAQDDEPVYQINLGPDKWWDVDKEAFDQVTIDAPQKRVLYTRPQPKAQEDEPVAVVTEENGEQVIDITRLMTLSRGTKIYARPANDELRRAAVALTEYCSGPMKPEIGRMIALTDNLRAVLRENYGTSSRIQ